MQVRYIIAGVAALAVATGITIKSYAAEEKDEAVSLAQAPAAVQETIKAQAANGKIGKIEKGDENGTVVYEAEITKDGKKSELTITADGKVKPEDADNKEVKAKGKEEKDETVALSQVPQVVQNTLNAQAAGSEIVKIEKGDENGTVVYEFDLLKDGKKSELTITADGKVKPEDADNKEEKAKGKEEKDETVALSQVPQVVQDTLSAQAAGSEIVKIEKGDENGTVVYEFDLLKDGKKSELTITADGKVKPEDADNKEEKTKGKEDKD